MPLDIRELNREELQAFLDEHRSSLLEDEALLVLANPFCTPKMALAIANDPRLTSYYSVRKELVRHRATPQAQALKFVHHLYWRDLLKFSTETRIAAAVRRGIEQQMLVRLPQRPLGEKIAAARVCSRELIRAFLIDPSPRVFDALLVNPRLTEDDLVAHVVSGRASPSQLTAISRSPKWSLRLPLRRALVMNGNTPKAVAASQLPHLPKADRQALAKSGRLSVYLKVCIERLERESRK